MSIGGVYAGGASEAVTHVRPIRIEPRHSAPLGIRSFRAGAAQPLLLFSLRLDPCGGAHAACHQGIQFSPGLRWTDQADGLTQHGLRGQLTRETALICARLPLRPQLEQAGPFALIESGGEELISNHHERPHQRLSAHAGAIAGGAASRAAIEKANFFHRELAADLAFSAVETEHSFRSTFLSSREEYQSYY